MADVAVVDINPQEHEAVYRRVVDLMHEAQEAGNDYDTRLTHLRTAKDLILNKSPELIDNFWTEMTSTRHMRSPRAVAYCLDWIRDACAKEPQLVKEKSIFSKEVLLRLMEDPSVVIQKRSLQAVTQIYRNIMKWIAGGGVVEAAADVVWQEVKRVKDRIVAAISGEEHAENHVGYRLLSYKFLQTVIECQSPREGPAAPKDDDPVCSLDIPDKWSGKVLSRKLVEAEANNMLDVLEGYLTRPTHTTEYVDCISVCGCLFQLAKRRPQYLARVMTAVEFLLSTIPESYTRLHVEGLRKYLKTALIVLLRRCQDPEILERTVQLLTRHFNTSQNEIYRNRANIGEMLRKKKREPEPEVAAKRQKTEEAYEDEDEAEPVAVTRDVPQVDYPSLATEITTNSIAPRLTPGVVVQLLLVSMRKLPTTMPTTFHATYTPIGSGPASGMLQHLARLLALQMVTADIGPGAEEVAKRKKEDTARQNAVAAAEEPAQAISSILNRVVSETHPADADGDSGDEGAEPDSAGDGMGAAEAALASGPVPDEYKATEKAFKLEEMTEAIPPDDRPNALLSILNELLAIEPRALTASAEFLFHKCLIHFAVNVGLEPLRERIAAFILEDIGSRIELAFRWLFEEYAHARRIQRAGHREDKEDGGVKDEEMDGEEGPALAMYDACLARFIRGLLEHPEYREGLVSQLYLEVPVVSSSAVGLLNEYCTLRSVHGAMRLILKLASSRPHPARYIVPALDLTLSQRKDLQSQAVMTCVKLYGSVPGLRMQIQTFAVDCMRLLGQEQVPAWLFTEKYGRTPEAAPEWNEELQRVCSSLFTGILAEDAGLLPVLGEMYVAHPNDVKKTIFKVIDQPVKTIGMNAPEMLQFVKNPPKGSESLVLRIIHLLTETNPPTGELISSIRALYAERIPDVRFLIPILNGLPKEDILAALPKLIKLNPMVVQELFHRLLGTGKHKLDSTQRRPSLSPAEVLIELHKIDISKVDAKSLIKATGLCLEEKELYGAETMVEVLRALIDAEPLPFLLMRTVLQTIQMHGARLTSFIMTLLHKLIQREVWNAPLLWEGFLKCCDKTTPHSYPVLLRLPLERLQGALESTPALKGQLQRHVTDLTDEQHSYLAPGVLELLQVDTRHREVRALEEAPVRDNGEQNPKEVERNVSREQNPRESSQNVPREASPGGRRRGNAHGSREGGSRSRDASRTAEGSSRSRERVERERSSTGTSRPRREDAEKGGSRKKRERERSRDRDGSRRHRHEKRDRTDEKKSTTVEKDAQSVKDLPQSVEATEDLPLTRGTSESLPDIVDTSDVVQDTADISQPVSETVETPEELPVDATASENRPEVMDTSEPAQETEDLSIVETDYQGGSQKENEVVEVASMVKGEETTGISPQSPELTGGGVDEVVEGTDALETSLDSPEM